MPAVMSAADKTTDDGNLVCFQWHQHDDLFLLSKSVSIYGSISVCECVGLCTFV